MNQALGDTAIIAGGEEAMSVQQQVLHIAAAPDKLKLPRDVLHLPSHWRKSQETIFKCKFPQWHNLG